MAAEPLTNEAIALTEKKMAMTLDDIIKMSKNNSTKASNKQRVSNKSRKFVNNVSQDRNAKMRRFLDSRSALRQGALAQRRSNFQGNKFSNPHVNQFPLASEVAKKAAVAPIWRPFSGSRAGNTNKPRTGALPVQRRGAANNGILNMKHQQPQQQQFKATAAAAPKQKPAQTLDSLFSDMQRSRVNFHQNNGQQHNSSRRNGVLQRLPPWQRARFAK